MLLKDLIHNIKVSIENHIMKYAYIYAPILGLIIYFFIVNIIEFDLDESFKSNLINVSGILAGFLFTSLGIILTLPDNKFTQLLRRTRHMRIIYNSMLAGITALLISMLAGLFNIGEYIAKIAFIIGISETFLSAYYIYRVSYFSQKSK